jgi:WD40 repeat protein
VIRDSRNKIGQFVVWDIKTRNKTPFPGPYYGWPILSPDGQRAAVATLDFAGRKGAPQTVEIIELDNPKKKKPEALLVPWGISAMAFTADGMELVVVYRMLSRPESDPPEAAPKKSFQKKAPKAPSLLSFRVVGLDAATGKELWQKDSTPKSISRMGGPSGSQIALSPDGKRKVSLDTLRESPVDARTGFGVIRQAVVGNTQSGEELGSFQPDLTGDCRMAFSPDGKRLALWSTDTRTPIGQVWDVETRRLLQTLKGHTAAVMALAFNADGTRLYSADARGALKEWEVVPDLRKGDGEGQRGVIVRMSKDGSIRAEYPSPRQVGKKTGKVQAREPTEIRIVSAEGKPPLTFSKHQDEVRRVEISADGQFVISVDRAGGVKIWETGGGRVLREYTGNQWGVLGPERAGFVPEFSPDGKRVAASLPEGGVKVWDLPKFREIFSKPDKAVVVHWSPDGKRLLAYVSSGDGARELKLWDVEADKLLHAGGAGLGFRFSPDGKRLAVILGPKDSDANIEKLKIMVLDTTSGTKLGEFQGENDRYLFPVISPDNRRLAVADRREVLVWDIASPEKEVFRLKGHLSPNVFQLAFSPDGKRLASVASLGDNQELILWDMVTGSEVMRARRHIEVGGLGTVLSFSPDGHRLVIRDESDPLSVRQLILDATPLPEQAGK